MQSPSVTEENHVDPHADIRSANLRQCVCARTPDRLGAISAGDATRTASFELAPDNRQNTSVQPANTSGLW
jgi:hypothetical protein